MKSADESLRHRRLTRLFTQARALGAESRAAWVAEACGEDLALQEDLRELLEADARGGALGDEVQAETTASQGLRSQLEEQLTRATGIEPDGFHALPDRIGPFHPKEIIGRGGMAIVYLAQQESPQRDVALKVLRGDVSAEAAARIEREADLLARLEHPSIARIYSAGRAQTPWGEQGYIAMELVNGRPLMRFAREENLNLRGRVALLARIAEALQVAHARGIVHRDLKPSNILVQRDGTPKLLDFGVARLRSLDPSDTGHTRTGQIVGTLATMSPEQAAGQSDVDERSDVYALGVLLFELCADRLPVETRGLPLHEAIRRIREDDPVALGAIHPNLRGDVETIALKALEKEPHRRYSDAGEFAADLRRFLADQPILARTQRWRDHARRFARRHRPLVAGVGIAFVGLAAALGISLFLLGRARAENRRAIRGREAALRLTDLRRLGQLERKALELWPANESLLGELDAWIAEAALVVGKLDWHESLLLEFGARFDSPIGQARLEIGERGRAMINGELWMYEAQSELVQGLTEFAAEGGLYDQIRERRIFAASLGERTVDRFSSLWDDVARVVVDPSGPYSSGEASYDLSPVPGLIPLGQDPHTGLLAFLVEASGVPQTSFDPAIDTVPDWGAAIVFLLPAVAGEAPLFVSAWEVGAGLWADFEGSPGFGSDASAKDKGAKDLISFGEAESFARRMGGRLLSLEEYERVVFFGLWGTDDGLAEWVRNDQGAWITGTNGESGSKGAQELRSESVGFRFALERSP